MLKVIANPTFTNSVVVNTKALQGSFNVVFIAKPSSECKRLEAAAIERGDGPQGLLFDVVQSHEEVEVFGEALRTAGADSIRRLLDIPGVGPAMLKAYYNGMWEEASGN